MRRWRRGRSWPSSLSTPNRISSPRPTRLAGGSPSRSRPLKDCWAGTAGPVTRDRTPPQSGYPAASVSAAAELDVARLGRAR